MSLSVLNEGRDEDPEGDTEGYLWVPVRICMAVRQEYGQEAFRENNFALEHLLWYVPECSVLWRPFVAPCPLGPTDLARLAAFDVAFAYLAWPVARVLARQLLASTRGAWRAARAGPGWRF